MAKKNGKLDGTGTTDPTVVPPGKRPPMTKEQILEEQRNRLAEEKRNRLRPKKRPGSGTVDKEGDSASQRRFQPPKDEGDSASQRRFQPPKDEGDSASQRRFQPPTRPKQEEPGGTLEGMGPEIVGRPRKPMQLAPIGKKHGGMVKKGGKSKVRGAGIARKGVRPAKMG